MTVVAVGQKGLRNSRFFKQDMSYVRCLSCWRDEPSGTVAKHHLSPLSRQPPWRDVDQSMRVLYLFSGANVRGTIYKCRTAIRSRFLFFFLFFFSPYSMHKLMAVQWYCSQSVSLLWAQFPAPYSYSSCCKSCSKTTSITAMPSITPFELRFGFPFCYYHHWCYSDGNTTQPQSTAVALKGVGGVIVRWSSDIRPPTTVTELTAIQQSKIVSTSWICGLYRCATTRLQLLYLLQTFAEHKTLQVSHVYKTAVVRLSNCCCFVNWILSFSEACECSLLFMCCTMARGTFYTYIIYWAD